VHSKLQPNFLITKAYFLMPYLASYIAARQNLFSQNA
jgi:hypothetical protein